MSSYSNVETLKCFNIRKPHDTPGDGVVLDENPVVRRPERGGNLCGTCCRHTGVHKRQDLPQACAEGDIG